MKLNPDLIDALAQILTVTISAIAGYLTGEKRERKKRK